MGQIGQFDYFYGMQADTYSFYRIPKILFTYKTFKLLSCEAKVLYGLMLDRMSLSIKNKWFDEQGRVYIIFMVQEVRDYMGCCRQTAINLLAELDGDKEGIGLIKKKRLGFGKANIIYVKNFVTQRESGEKDSGKEGDDGGESEMGGFGESAPDPAIQIIEETDDVSAGVRESSMGSGNHTSRSLENRLLEVQDAESLKSINQTSRNRG